ncbi:MAG: roadblock/LC7 domain-containing protein [Chloroflexi bacterium]|uniref:Roadblock/LC7 domain-containing protein n=1 Tax=Candidatus Chlorohelix allophototropha TaxID=3003348 RepID=A0A8T7LRT3_9CHLR|nr:roadblock/LC7 domain-containing protein [Chloroflexota bacterium]WJW66610.1 roadblock/LC7 domain-containing protein [Chloroflexota bacterium L227-S17]
MNRREELVGHLRKLQAAAPEIEASAVVSLDGLIIASNLPDAVEPDRVSAMSAALLALSMRISGELNRGLLEQVFIRGLDGDILLMAVGEDAVLTVISKREAKLGMVQYYMKRAARDIAKVLF